MPSLYLTLLLSFWTVSCKTRGERADTQTMSTDARQKDEVLDLISKIKVSSIPERTSNELGLAGSWREQLGQLLNSKEGGVFDTPMVPAQSYFGKAREYLSGTGEAYQKKLWNEAFEDWKVNKEHDVMDSKYSRDYSKALVPNFDLLKKVIAESKDFKIHGSYIPKGALSGAEMLLIEGPSGTFALLVRDKNGKMSVLNIDKFDANKDRILAIDQNYAVVSGLEHTKGGPLIGDLPTIYPELTQAIKEKNPNIDDLDSLHADLGNILSGNYQGLLRDPVLAIQEMKVERWSQESGFFLDPRPGESFPDILQRTKDFHETLEASYDHAWNLVSGSSNLGQKWKELNINSPNRQAYTGETLSQFRRSLQFSAMRADMTELSAADREFVDEVQRWNLNMYMDESKEIPPISEREVTIGGEKLQMKKVLVKLRVMARKLTSSTSTESVESFALNSVKWRLANCGEYSRLVYTHLLEAEQFKADKITMELLSSSSVDHQFVVIGRQTDGSLSDLGTWGKGAYIVDPWWQFFGPVEDYKVLVEGRLKTEGIASLKTLIKGQVGEGHSASWSTRVPSDKNFSLMTSPTKSFQEMKDTKEVIEFAP